MNATSSASRSQWGWWIATALLLVGVIIDVIDGQPLKLATSVSLFIASVVASVTRPPRPAVARAVIVAGVVVGVGLIVYRLVGPGL